MLRQCLFFGDFEGFYAYKLDAYKKKSVSFERLRFSFSSQSPFNLLESLEYI